MGLRLYNTATRRKEVFQPLDPENVRMYVCGPTVYDRAHLGNARPVVVFDVLCRLLRHIYGEDHVTYVRNFTDVDDKINARAREMQARGDGRSMVEIIRALTDETIEWYHADMDALGALRPTHEPRATDYIAQMVAMIGRLIDKRHAYAAEGHVLFDVGSYTEYGQLARRNLDEMRAGARVEVAPYKRDPMDFVLWKPSADDEPGWDSPWGRGRPGWHIECSAMSLELLGESFDIHGGGIDLQFPHHENEIAQSRCACPEGRFAQVWMHNGFVQVEGEKMSKSLGNFFTVQDLLAKGVPGAVIRFVLLSTHYRQPLDWTEDKVREATKTLRNWAYACLGERREIFDEELLNALSDDLNTPEAISQLSNLFGDERPDALLGSAKLLGLDLADIANQPWARLFEYEAPDNSYLVEGADYMPSVGVSKWGGISEEQRDAAIRLVHRWMALRRERDFEDADRLRRNAAQIGVELRATRLANGINSGHAHLEGDISPSDLEALR